MTIQQGTSDRIYPLSDIALPIIETELHTVRLNYDDAASVRVNHAPVPWKYDTHYPQDAITILELNDRFIAHHPRFVANAEISSEATPAAIEGGRLYHEAVLRYKLRTTPSDASKATGEDYLLSLYGLGQSRPLVVAAFDVQSMVDNYLFGTPPVTVAERIRSSVAPHQPYIASIPASNIAAFKSLMEQSRAANLGDSVWKGRVASLDCTVCSHWPVMPKIETDRYASTYVIDSLMRLYLGMASLQLDAAAKAMFVEDGWLTRIRYLVRSVALAQCMWSMRFNTAYPTLYRAIPTPGVSADPSTW